VARLETACSSSDGSERLADLGLLGWEKDQESEVGSGVGGAVLSVSQCDGKGGGSTDKEGECKGRGVMGCEEEGKGVTDREGEG